MDELKTLRKLIREVKQELDLGILTEGTSKELVREGAEQEQAALRAYVARNIVDLIKECGE